VGAGLARPPAGWLSAGEDVWGEAGGGWLRGGEGLGASGARAQRKRSRSVSGWPGCSGAEGALEYSAGLSGAERRPHRSAARPGLLILYRWVFRR
jgi:hypothetical protein